MDLSRTQIELIISLGFCLILVIALIIVSMRIKEKENQIKKLIQEKEEIEQEGFEFEEKTLLLEPDQYLEIIADHAVFLFVAGVEEFGPDVKLRKLFEKTLIGDTEPEYPGYAVGIGNEQAIKYHRYWTCTVPTMLHFAYYKETVDFYVDNIKFMPGYRG